MENKTDIALQIEFSKLLPEEKFGRMLSMCKTVRTIIYSRLPDVLNNLEKRRFVFEVYYKNDFSDDDFKKISEMIFGRSSENRS